MRSVRPGHRFIAVADGAMELAAAAAAAAEETMIHSGTRQWLRRRRNIDGAAVL